MPTLSTHALAQLQVIRATYGEAAFADFKLYIESSVRFTLQVEAYFDPSRGGTVNVDAFIGNGAEYRVDRDDILNGGLNNARGLITFPANVNYSDRFRGWSVGYGLAEAFAHELGHAFDPRLGATAQQNAFEQGGFRQQTLVRTESEAAGQINAYLLMSEARSNLRAAAANPYVNLPFDPNMQVTAFRFAEGAIKGFLQTTAAADFEDTCSVNAACLSQVTNAMGRSGYFNSIFQQLTGNLSATFPAQQLVLGEEGNYSLVTNTNNPNQIDVIDKTTLQVVQSINAQLFEDGTSLLTISNRDGSIDSVSVDASGRSIQMSPVRDANGIPLLGQETILIRDRWNATESTAHRTNYEDGSSLTATTYASGRSEVLSTDTSGTPFSRIITIPGQNNTESVQHYRYVGDTLVIQSNTATQFFYDENGVSRIEDVTTFAANGRSTTIRTAYDIEGNAGAPQNITVAPSILNTASNATSSMSSIGAYNPGNSFIINSPPGDRVHPITGVLTGHQGVDYSRAPGVTSVLGLPIPAAADGIVVANGFQYNQVTRTGWGNYVVIQHTRSDGTTFQTLYAHLQTSSPLAVGSFVAAGQSVGPVGHGKAEGQVFLCASSKQNRERPGLSHIR